MARLAIVWGGSWPVRGPQRAVGDEFRSQMVREAHEGYGVRLLGMRCLVGSLLGQVGSAPCFPFHVGSRPLH
eukprot:7318161-Pyramimonas_sp.AAC.1